LFLARHHMLDSRTEIELEVELLVKKKTETELELKLCYAIPELKLF